MMTSEDVGKVIKRIRESKKITRYSLAQKSSVTHPTVCYAETGKRNLSWNTAVLILDALGCDVRIVKKGECNDCIYGDNGSV